MAHFETHVTASDIACAEQRPGASTIVIFGASGSLSITKLIPALFNLYRRELLPESFEVIGVARTEMNDETFRMVICQALGEACSEISIEQRAAFVERFTYLRGDYGDPGVYEQLLQCIAKHRSEGEENRTCAFYLATPPKIFPVIVAQLGEKGLASLCVNETNCARVVIEKPFGSNLESAHLLSREVSRHFQEHQIYRIDHYMGKETVQNMLMFRFANAIFEPVWNRRYIDHVQISVAEAEGIGERAGYYEDAGHLRDVFQNHLLQMLSIVAMEPPASFEADCVRNERAKLLRALRPMTEEDVRTQVVRGQYDAGIIADEAVRGYREEKGVPQDSQTETYVATKLWIDNWRWQGVPFFLRAGKRLKKRKSEIAIAFKHVPHSMFQPLLPQDLKPNVLCFHVQPEEGISLSIQAKHPGPKLCMTQLSMDFNYHTSFHVDLPGAYERLLLDCMLGDQTLFIRNDALEIAWAITDTIRRGWDEGTPPLESYKAGSEGPAGAMALMREGDRVWRPLG